MDNVYKRETKNKGPKKNIIKTIKDTTSGVKNNKRHLLWV